MILQYLSLTLILGIVFNKEQFYTLENYDRVLKMNEKLHYKVHQKDSNIFMPFEFTVPEDIDFETERLMILTRPDDYRSDPDLVIHDTLTDPNEEILFSQEYLPYFCYHYGPDFCFIPKEYLIPGKVLKVYIYIQFGPCEFNMMVYKMKTDHTMLDLNQEYMIFLKDNDKDFEETLSTYFSVRLPTEFENPNLDYFTISALHDDSIFGYTISSQLNDHDMHLMFSIGENVDPQTNNQYLRQGLFVVENGIIFKIKKDSPYWKPGEIYNFVITSQDRDQIRVLPRAGNSQEIQTLQFDQYFEVHNRKIPEILHREETMTYKISNFNQLHNQDIVQDQQMSTIITLHQTFGITDMYVDCNMENVKNLEKSQFIVKDSGNDSLMISSEELEQNCENLYITIQSIDHTSAFNLEIGFKPEDLVKDTILSIRPHVTQFGYLKSDEIAAYIFELDRDTKQKVTIQLEALQGNSDLYVRKCGKNDECMVSRDFMNEKDYAKDPQFIGFSQIQGNDVISFQHSQTTCYDYKNQNNKRPYCLYAIFVYNKQYQLNDQLNESLKYKLSVELEKKPTYLKENQMIFGDVQSGQLNYYIFDIGNFDNIQQIAFVMTPVSGDPNIIVSRTEKQPYYSNSDFSFTWKDYLSYNETDWAGREDETTFYIAVHGFTEALYGITVQITRYNQEGQIHPNVYSLINGIYMSAIFSEEQRYLYFELPIKKVNNLVQLQLIDMNQHFTQNLEIYGQPITQENSKEFQDNEDNYPYFSNTSVIQIDRSLDSSSEGYRFMVKRVNSDISEKYFFKILAQSLDEFINIVPGEERQLIIYKAQEYNQQKELYRAVMFKFTVDLSQDQEVHMSINSEIYRNAFYAQFFAMKENALLAFQGGQKDIQIEQEKNRYFMAFINFNQVQLKQMCQSQPKNKCQIQGLIKTFGEDSVFHDDFNVKANLLLLKVDQNNESSLIKLQKNKTIKIPVISSQEQPIMYQMYYSVDNINETFFIDIQGSDIYGVISLHFFTGDIKDIDENEKYKETLQDISKSDITQKFMHYHQQFEPSEIKQYCQQDQHCHLFVAIQSNSNNKFMNIQIGGDIMDISGQMNEFIKGIVGQDEYKYFKVFFPADSEYMRFHLNMINTGDANLIVYYSEDDDIFRPRDHIQNELCAEASNNAGNYLCKRSININKSDEVEFKPGKKGFYIIGVYGQDSGENLFDIHWTTNGLRELQKGITNQFLAPNKEPKYYFYTTDKFSKNDLTLLLSSDVQLIKNIKISILVCDDPRSWLISQSQFCVPSLAHPAYDFVLDSLNLDVIIQKMCDNVEGPDCHIMFSFQSLVQNKDIELEGILVEQIEGYQKVILKPGKYIQSEILQDEVHQYQLMFFDPENLKTHFLNINSLYGDLKIKVLPESLKIQNIMGQENQLWAKIQSSHAQKNDFFKDKNQLSTLTVEISGCKDSYGCEYGLGISIEGEPFELYPGAVYTGIASTQQSQIFKTKIDKQITKQKQHYLTLNTYTGYGNINLGSLEIHVQIKEEEDSEKIKSYIFDIEQGSHSHLITLRQKSPIIEIKLVQNGKQVNSIEVEYSLVLQNGSVTQLVLQDKNRYTRNNSIQKEKYSRESPDIYVVESNKAGQILIEIEECYKEFTLIYSDSYDKLLKNLSKKFVNTVRNQMFMNVKENKKYYVAVDLYDESDGFKSTQDQFSKTLIPTRKIKNGSTGIYSIKSYYFESQESKFEDQYKKLPQNIFIAGNEGKIDHEYIDQDLYIMWQDIEFKNVPKDNQIMKKYTQGGSSVWARVTISNSNENAHQRLQKCGYIPSKSIFKRRVLELDNEKTPVNENENQQIEKDQERKQHRNMITKTYLLQNVDKNYSKPLIQGDVVYGYDYTYKIPIKEVINQFGQEQKNFRLSVTMIIPPSAYENLPIENYYDINVYYQTEKIEIKLNQNNGNKGIFNGDTDDKNTPIITYIEIIIGVILGIAITAFIIRRIILSKKKKQEEDKQVIMADISSIEQVDQY